MKYIQCFIGVSATTIDARPAFDGYKYHEHEYCSEPTYDNDASTIDEAVAKCTNDPDCAAIEDRWATGKAPIGLCKRTKGKRAGGGTYLLKKGNYITKLLRELGTFSSNVYGLHIFLL